MRLCRYDSEGSVLVGFYRDDRVLAVADASASYRSETGRTLDIPPVVDPLALLPPDGDRSGDARALATWLDGPGAAIYDQLGLPTESVRLLTPIAMPPKILLLAGNYAKHVQERGGTTAERKETFPYVFMKPRTTLTNPGDPIVIPAGSPDHVDWECELGVVIGRRCRGVSESEALGFVAAYTVVNDVSDRKFRPNPGRKPRERDAFFDWLHGKWHDTFCPVGPCLRSALDVPDPQALTIRLAVNGEVKQDASTSQMVFPVAAVVAYISSWITLEPGDLIATGTPAGVGSARGESLRPGDVVEASIGGIGTLTNPAAADPGRA